MVHLTHMLELVHLILNGLVLLQPPKPPLDILMEVGGSGREDDLIGPLESFDGVGSLKSYKPGSQVAVQIF